MRPSSGGYTQKMVNLQTQYARSHRRVISRAKSLYGVIMLSVCFVGHVLHTIVTKRSFTDMTGSPLETANATLLFVVCGYFLVAKDENMTALILKLLMIFTGIQFFIGSFVYGSLIVTLLGVGVQYYAYTQVFALKDSGL